MHFIPGALTLDGASLEENRAAAEGEAKIVHKPVEGNLNKAASLPLSEVGGLIELGETKKNL